MPENVIVTLRFQGREGDFEIPARAPVRALEESLKQAMRLQFPGVMLEGKAPLLRIGDGDLSPEHTLEDYGLYDGSIIELELIDAQGE